MTTRNKRLSWLKLGRPWDARIARAYSPFSALKLRAARISRKELRLRGRAQRQAAASASMFSEDVTKQDGGVAEDWDEDMHLRRLAAANGSDRAQYDLYSANDCSLALMFMPSPPPSPPHLNCRPPAAALISRHFMFRAVPCTQLPPVRPAFNSLHFSAVPLPYDEERHQRRLC